MKLDPRCATPDLMALLCLIGGIVRDAGSRNLVTPLLLVGTFSPPLGHALRLWIAAEECYATTEFECAASCDMDGVGGCDDIRPGWLGRHGPVMLWRHVDRFGVALLIPIQWAWMARKRRPPTPGLVWAPVWVLSNLSPTQFFAPVLAVV